APAPVTRADLEKFGVPILRAVIPVRSADALLTITDAKGGTVTWSTTDGTTFTQRDGVLIQTRGLGPDLMSAQAPSAAALRTDGGTHQRVYFFLGENDGTTRRTYDCTVTAAGTEEIEIFARTHKVEKFTETCARPQGSITNTFWFEGPVIRKSKQLASGGLGFIDFEQVID
ncbi:MAG: YjbF family lipoprotein, partial [Rhodobacteraceae bacterium]|nr:YjbF family lipoprotein [Paracoccaceae bacterium]